MVTISISIVGGEEAATGTGPGIGMERSATAGGDGRVVFPRVSQPPLSISVAATAAAKTAGLAHSGRRFLTLAGLTVRL